ncbi:MAG: YqaJ viral recombinase family protein [Dechloromonas sp.]|nr:YqaJ viral recombinase family protein [Dechloromonas sp.]
MTIKPFPQTSLGSAAAAVVDTLEPLPPGIERIVPSSREEWLGNRAKFIGASECSALLGIHPYMTPYELFMRKTGAIEAERSAPDIRDDSIHLPPMERGNFLEEKALELARMLRPNWSIVSNPIPGGSVFADRAAGIASTPDATIKLPDGSRATLQIKNIEPSIFSKKWKEDGEITPPLWIVVQSAQDAVLYGAERAFIGAMTVGFNVDFHLIEAPIHHGVLKKVRTAVADFWGMVERREPPPPDFARDGALIADLYADDDDSTISLAGNERIGEILKIREKLKAREADGSAAAKERKPLDAEIIQILGNAARARLADGRLLEAKTIYRAGYSVAPSQYRTVQIKKG